MLLSGIQPAKLALVKQSQRFLEGLEEEIQPYGCEREGTHKPVSEPVACWLQHVQDLHLGSNTHGKGGEGEREASARW